MHARYSMMDIFSIIKLSVVSIYWIYRGSRRGSVNSEKKDTIIVKTPQNGLLNNFQSLILNQEDPRWRMAADFRITVLRYSSSGDQKTSGPGRGSLAFWNIFTGQTGVRAVRRGPGRLPHRTAGSHRIPTWIQNPEELLQRQNRGPRVLIQT